MEDIKKLDIAINQIDINLNQITTKQFVSLNESISHVSNQLSQPVKPAEDLSENIALLLSPKVLKNWMKLLTLTCLICYKQLITG
ncbi:MAG: hypothetical protein GY795_39765 [Desulfobacterales bacterium]|nr:hypothetical protein [Desulfobacterales bacterium]